MSRADLARLLDAVPDDEAGERAAMLLGFDAPFVEKAPPMPTPSLKLEPSPDPPPEAPRATMSSWRLEKMTFTDASEPRLVEPSIGLSPEDLKSPGSLFATPDAKPLASWSRLWPALRSQLQAPVPGRDPDVPELVRAWGRGENVTRIPRVSRQVWAGRASVWVDRSARLVPFWSDQEDVYRRLRKMCGRSGVDVRVLDGATQARSIAGRGHLLTKFRPDPMVAVLVLGDLGMYGSELERDAWLRSAERLGRAGVRIAALVPCPPSRWARDVAKGWQAVSWECRRKGASGANGRREQAFWDGRASRLLDLAAVPALVQPGLLRALRLLLPATEVDAASEADAWRHADVRAADATGLVLHPEAAERRRATFATNSPELKEAVRQAIREWHEGLPRELLWAETLVWHGIASTTKAPGNLEEAIAFARRLDATLKTHRGPTRLGAEVRRFGRSLLGGMPAAVYKAVPELERVWAASFEGMNGVAVPDGLDLRAAYAGLEGAGEPRWWAARQVGSKLVLSPLEPEERGAWPSQDRGPGSPVARVLAARAEMEVIRGTRGVKVVLEPGAEIELVEGVAVELRTDRSTVRLTPWDRNEHGWSAAGRDRFGLWADADLHGVVQRFRWIPPGRLTMGSPESMVGRRDDEMPHHQVTLTSGYWLATTPVTQALWQAVTGKNPSRFVSPDRPVEQVSWVDCQRFIESINTRPAGFDVRLPSEAEWEHACRAGTQTATWVGDLEVLVERNALLVDPIAWYGGNSGVGVEFLTDLSVWPKKQHRDAPAGTHPVGRKAPNPYGLHDMLGNVDEWCQDGKRRYTADSVNDPHGPEEASDRVVRGGSWRTHARNVRSASRLAYPREDYSASLGFRLARGPAPGPGAEPEAAERPAEKRDA